jgi:hypothetical protein
MKMTVMIPDSPARLRKLLLLIFDGRASLRFAGVNVPESALHIVWRDEARADDYPNVSVPLKRSALGEAQRLVEHLLLQGLAPSEAAAEELFGMVEFESAGAAADYDGITPAEALVQDPTLSRHRPLAAVPPQQTDQS